MDYTSPGGLVQVTGIANPDDLVWVVNSNPNSSNAGQMDQAPREVFSAAVLAPVFHPNQQQDEYGRDIPGTSFYSYPGTAENPLDVSLIQARYLVGLRTIGGGGFFSGLVDAVKPVLAPVVAIATVGLPALQVGGATTANVAANVVQGQPLLQNAAIAGAVDVAALAAGEGIAASGIANAGAIAPTGEVVGAGVDQVVLPAVAAPVETATPVLDAGAALDPAGLAASDAAGVAATGGAITPGGILAGVSSVVPSGVVSTVEAAAGKLTTGVIASQLAGLIPKPKPALPPLPQPIAPLGAPATPAPANDPLLWIAGAALAFKLIASL